MSRILKFQLVSLDSTSTLRLLHLLLESRRGMRASPSRDISIEQLIDFFEGLPRGLGIGEEDVEGHGDTEGAEDHVRLPLDVGECGRDEEGESQIEPIKDVSSGLRDACHIVLTSSYRRQQDQRPWHDT